MKVMEMMENLGDREVVEIVDMTRNRRFTGLGKRYVAENPSDELKKVSTVGNRLVLYVIRDGNNEKAVIF